MWSGHVTKKRMEQDGDWGISHTAFDDVTVADHKNAAPRQPKVAVAPRTIVNTFPILS
jgi:hypothetical protein